MTPAQHATLTFRRPVAAPAERVWHCWTDPAARAAWSAPSPNVTVEYLSADTRPGGTEVSLCRAPGEPEVRCEVGWIAVDDRRSVNSEVLYAEGAMLSAALVTAEVTAEGAGSTLVLTVQLVSLGADMEDGYRAGFPAGLANLARLAEETP